MAQHLYKALCRPSLKRSRSLQLFQNTPALKALAHSAKGLAVAKCVMLIAAVDRSAVRVVFLRIAHDFDLQTFDVSEVFPVSC